ncbi:hypothetical protein BGZ80_004426 [Entomortierella chlamydospora]|uniref:D-arabinono-1,4-lactone oxidase n=1 Tax=Entomortierella chlamydospora TaxID=101097 RepID=A0A9P6N144_9FUNG|nr:hypothetical protein BGZ80_004426 [Entomortierella chlamydospora]
MAVINDVSFSDDSWTNWGKNLTSQPEATFYPNKLEDLKVIVREAKANNKKIRCAGTGHSWCGAAVTDGYLVSVNNMNKIHPPKETNQGWTVTIESGVTVEELDLALRAHSPPLALPSNVHPTSVRYGGILTMGCHGPSLNSRTMSDMITELVILNAEGNLVTYSEDRDPEAFNAASLNLGLFGIVYTATLRVEVMNTRFLARDSERTFETVFDGPDAGLKLKAMVLKNDSTEFFHWPFRHFMKPEQNRTIWVKEWERTTEPAEKVNPNLNRPPTVDNPFFSEFHAGERVQEIPDALHFHLGDGVTTILDAGVGFKVDNDFKNVIEAFSELIEKNWAFTTSMPERMGTAVEMRFIKSSSKILSPAYDQDPEAIFCMIDVMATSETPGFEEYAGGIVANWIEKYNAKPHWPKLWESVPGVVPYLRREYGDRLVRFNKIRKTQDPNDMFLNNTWRPLMQDL